MASRKRKENFIARPLEKLTAEELRALILQVANDKRQELDLKDQGLTELPREIGLLTHLRHLDLASNQLATLPREFANLINLQSLDLSSNKFTVLPETVDHLKNLELLNVTDNKLKSLSSTFGQLINLKELSLYDNLFEVIPSEIFQIKNLERLNIASTPVSRIGPEIGDLANLKEFTLGGCPLTDLPAEISHLKKLHILWLWSCNFSFIPPVVFELSQLQEFGIGTYIEDLPPEIGRLTNLVTLDLRDNKISKVPPEIGRLSKLRELTLGDIHWGNQISEIPAEVGQLSNLRFLRIGKNKVRSLPLSIANLEKLEQLDLRENPLDPVLQSVYDQGLDAVMAYLRGLNESEPLYEAKLVLLGEGGVGKTTLLKALSGREPRENEPTTHGINIDVHSLHLPHPAKPDVQIQLNAWDFGGQEVYRVTHQFFFSRRSVYLLVWEPRMGVQQCQVDDWLKLIRLRVGDEAKVIIASTHAKTGQRIARIDKPVFLRDYGNIIVDFIEVDSLTDDPATGEKYGIAELKGLISAAAKDLEQMGSKFNVNWRSARDELIQMGETRPCVSYLDVSEVCSRNKLEPIETRTLAGLMHDLGYMVFYGDDERLRDDVVLQPEWLTKAIGFVLEDRATQEREGVLPDNHLEDVWLNHPFENEPRYDREIYPFFLRLMEKYDVSYRLEEGNASLVAQHVPQVRPSLPWLPEEEPKANMRRLAMVCVMEDAPPGLIPWMIVRTHQYAFEQNGHRLHWQKGMFLRNTRHGEAILELRGRELHLYTEALWPDYFMNILRQTLTKLIDDNWPGMEGRYAFTVPCRYKNPDGEMCSGRFQITALRQFLDEGDETCRCQMCRTRQDIVELLFGFEDEEPREQLQRIEAKIEAGFLDLESRLANSVMAIMQAMANEAKEGPRLFDIQPVDGNWRRLFEQKFRLRLWCEAENNQHPVLEPDRGTYEFKTTREWVRQVAPYANFVAGMLKTLVPMVAPGVNLMFGEKTIENLGLGPQLDLMKEATGRLEGDLKLSGPAYLGKGVLSEDERSGLLALHALLRELDPQHARLGLRRVPTYTGDFQWLCDKHYQLSQPRIPETIS